MNTASLAISALALLISAVGTAVAVRVAIRRDRADVAEALERKLAAATEAGRREALQAAEIASLREQVGKLEGRADD